MPEQFKWDLEIQIIPIEGGLQVSTWKMGFGGKNVGVLVCAAALAIGNWIGLGLSQVLSQVFLVLKHWLFIMFQILH